MTEVCSDSRCSIPLDVPCLARLFLDLDWGIDGSLGGYTSSLGRRRIVSMDRAGAGFGGWWNLG